MEQIVSQVEPGRLLHGIVRYDEFGFNETRVDLIEPNHFIQCSMLTMNKGKTFKPHKHIWKIRNEQMVIAQESWVVIKGSVKVSYYDTNGILLRTAVLYAGDASFTLQGGHNYEALEDNTRVYEYKTGPYQGQEMDKVFL